MSFTLTSPAFADGAPIPQRCSGDGANLSPPLTWQDPPTGTRSFALVVEDPDAPSGTFRHWGIYDIDAETRQLPEGAAGPFAVAVNDNGRQGYGGPRPPKGHGPHHYHFRLMALDTERLDLPPSARVADISRAAQPHLLDEAVLTGIYER